jgi:membrane protease YdiL (CAAX protease family)
MSLFDVPNLWLVIVRLATLLLTAFLAWVTYRSHLLLKQFKPDFNLLLSPPEVVVRVLLAGFCLLLAWLSGLTAGQLGLVTNNPLQIMGLGLGISIAAVVIINLLTSWSISRFGQQVYSPLVIRNIMPRHAAEWVLVILAFMPATAMEELLFRTLWLGGFRGTMPLPLLIIGTSVIFGLMHQPQGYLGMIIAGSINILFSVLFIWSGTLLLPLVAHYFVNVLQLIIAYQQKSWLENY